MREKIFSLKLRNRLILFAGVLVVLFSGSYIFWLNSDAHYRNYQKEPMLELSDNVVNMNKAIMDYNSGNGVSAFSQDGLSLVSSPLLIDEAISKIQTYKGNVPSDFVKANQDLLDACNIYSDMASEIKYDWQSQQLNMSVSLYDYNNQMDKAEKLFRSAVSVIFPNNNLK